MDLTEPREGKELFLRIVGTDESDISKIIERYEKKSMSLMDMFINELEKEIKEVPQVSEIEPIGARPLEDNEEFLEEDIAIVPIGVLTELLLHQKYTNDYIKYYLKLHKPAGYEVCVRQLNHRNKDLKEFTETIDIELED